MVKSSCSKNQVQINLAWAVFIFCGLEWGFSMQKRGFMILEVAHSCCTILFSKGNASNYWTTLSGGKNSWKRVKWKWSFFDSLARSQVHFFTIVIYLDVTKDWHKVDQVRLSVWMSSDWLPGLLKPVLLNGAKVWVIQVGHFFNLECIDILMFTHTHVCRNQLQVNLTNIATL